MKPLGVALVTMASVFVCGTALAEATPQPMPMDSRVVVYQYEPNNTYTVLTRPGAMTTITFSEDEDLVGFAIGDTIRWKAEEAGRHIFIKPMTSGLFTTAALVTTKRTYLLNLRSSPESGIWYQAVYWEYPRMTMVKHLAVQGGQKEPKKEAGEERKTERDAEQKPASFVDDPTQLNFDYRIDGDERIRPQLVFDNGKFTWIKLQDTNQEMPVVMMEDDGKLELMNYVVKGNYIVVQQTFDKAVLRVGKRAAEIVRKKTRSAPDPLEAF